MFIEKLKQFNLVNPAWIRQDGIENVNRFQYRLTYGQWPPDPVWLTEKIPAKLDANGTMRVFELTPDIVNDYIGKKAPKSVMEYKLMKAESEKPIQNDAKLTTDEIEAMQRNQAQVYKQQQVALMQQMQYMQKLQQLQGQNPFQNQQQVASQQRPLVGVSPPVTRHEF